MEILAPLNDDMVVALLEECRAHVVARQATEA
jgi:hypothetical protein